MFIAGMAQDISPPWSNLRYIRSLHASMGIIDFVTDLILYVSEERRSDVSCGP
jgi:hypothetical protein